LIEAQPDGAVIDCGGVGYDVSISAVTRAQLPAEGEEVTLRVYTHVMESRSALFGFATIEERLLFDLLITVKNVGPQTAVGILSGATPQALARTIAAGDLVTLTRIRGVGKKTAELIVVELKEKCEYLLATWPTAAGGAGPGGAGADGIMPPSTNRAARSTILDDVASALVNLGWRPVEADKAVQRLKVEADSSLDVLLRQALRGMAR
jgi:Holliday junction DNA helicase RuvA